MISLQRLEALVALAEHGTMTAAAEALGHGQPTVSHHLSRLEREVKVRLFQTAGRGVRLTPAGERLAARGQEILALVRRAEGEARASVGLEAGSVRLATFPSAAATLVPAALGLLAERSGVRVDLTEAEPPEALDLVRRGEADIALSFGFTGPGTGADLTAVELLHDPLLLVTPGPAAGGLPAYADARWLSGCERCQTELVSACAAQGFAPDIRYSSDDYVAIQGLVAGGQGVTTLPQLALDAYTHPGVVATPIPGEGRTIHAVTLGRPPHPPAVDAVLACLGEAAAAWRGDPGPAVAAQGRASRAH